LGDVEKVIALGYLECVFVALLVNESNVKPGPISTVYSAMFQRTYSSPGFGASMWPCLAAADTENGRIARP
jgi:hypothetical protein